MSDMLIEVDDALRAQQMKALWDKYGQWLVGIVIAVVVATTIGVIWNNILNNSLTQQSNMLLTILQDEAENKDTGKKLVALTNDANFPLKSVVGLYRAQKLEQEKDLKAAQAVYTDMITQRRLPKLIQDLARVHSVRLGFIQQQKPDALLKTIEPVASDEAAPFNASAMELKGLLLAQQGKKEEANAIFNKLATGTQIPGTMRQRAKAMISYEDTNAK